MDFNENIELEIEKELARNLVGNRCFGVKIVLHYAQGRSPLNEVCYYNKGFRFECFNRWRWFFRFRAASIQVKFPKYYVELISFDYEVVATDKMIEKRREEGD